MHVMRFAIGTMILAATAAQAQAGMIAAWDTLGLAGNEASVAATFAATNISGLSLTRGAGLIANAGANSFNSANWDDLTGDEFVQLGFNVTAGSPWLVESIRMGTRSSATGPGFVNVNVSVDGGAFFTADTLNQPDALFINPIVNINQIVASSLVIRFAAASNTAANGGTIGAAGTWRIGDYQSPTGAFEDIIVEGSVVPEPASLVLIGLGGLGMTIGVARRRRNMTKPSLIVACLLPAFATVPEAV